MTTNEVKFFQKNAKTRNTHGKSVRSRPTMARASWRG